MPDRSPAAAPAQTPDAALRRQAARTATLVAVPLALAVAAFGLWSAGVLRSGPAAPTPAPTTAVSLPAPALASPATDVCRAVIAKLPATLRGAARRPVSAGAEQNAAYGEPPITVSCGVAPLTLNPLDQVQALSGVCWYGEATSGGTIWTTVDRQIPVAVHVPGPRDGSAQSVIPLSSAVGTNDPLTPRPPAGCSG